MASHDTRNTGAASPFRISNRMQPSMAPQMAMAQVASTQIGNP